MKRAIVNLRFYFVLGFSLTCLSDVSAAALVSTSVVSASEAQISAETEALQPGDKPTPVSGFKFKDGKLLWDRSVMPIEESLVSAWLMVGWADLSYDFAGMKDQYNESGIQSADGSAHKLRFGVYVNPVTQQKVLTSEFLDWGGKRKNMGPYESSIDSASQSAIASFFAGSGTLKSYFRMDCRESANSPDQLVCGVTLKMDKSEKGRYPKQDAFDNVMGGIAIFKRLY